MFIVQNIYFCLGSSMVERLAVNQKVVGSIPTQGGLRD